MTNQRDDANETARKAIERVTMTETRVTTLRAENSTLRDQLVEANARLQDHSVPERAEFERLRLKAEKTDL